LRPNPELLGPLALFCDVLFWDRALWTTCLDWLWTMILLISSPWVARITGVSHWHLSEVGVFASNFISFVAYCLSKRDTIVSKTVEFYSSQFPVCRNIKLNNWAEKFIKKETTWGIIATGIIQKWEKTQLRV
jgi:hypothetical protein